MTSGKFARAGGHSFGVAAALAVLTGQMAMADPAFAGSFQVNPVNIILPTDRQAASLTIKNSDAAPVSVKATAYAWTQQDGRGVYSETTNLIISPPIFTIPAGATQLVRTGLRTRDAGAYRDLHRRYRYLLAVINES